MDNEEHLQNLKARAEELHSYLPPEAKQMAALRSKYDKLAWGALYAAAAGDITSYDDLLHEFVSIGLGFDDEALQLTPQCHRRCSGSSHQPTNDRDKEL